MKRFAFLLIAAFAAGTLLTGCHSRNDEDSDARFDDVGEQHVYDDHPKHEKNKITLKAQKASVAEDRSRHQMIGEMSIDE